jgi:dTDP-4-dehydrorhamnose reductase
MRLLILGATGMLGHALLRELSTAEELDVYGTVRRAGVRGEDFPAPLLDHVRTGVDATDLDAVGRVLADLRPGVVVNCVGVVKQDPGITNVANTISVNALLPHQLAGACAAVGARLIHISTDCVFSGATGNYTEEDRPDADDLYGRAKLLGEVTAPPALTLRTSIIGHELGSSRSLVDWFLANSGVVRGFTRAIYSGVTTIELARMLRSVILPRDDLTGLLHVAAAPISKHDLLALIATAYGWEGELVPDDGFVCDRSLSAARLFSLTGYRPPDWPEQVWDLRRAAPSRRRHETAA